MPLRKIAKKLQRVIVSALKKILINNLLHTRSMYTISTDKSRLDVAMIHRYLSEESYWARKIPRDLVERSIENSICFGAYDGVLDSYRGRAVSKQLMQAIRDHPISSVCADGIF
jgi:hypothetical protein